MANYDEDEAFGMASKMGKNATEADIKNVAENMSKMNRGPLAKIWDKVTQLWEAFKSPKTPAGLKAVIIGGLIYMVSPIDLIPDFIPVAGLLDDVGVIGFAFSQLVRLGLVFAPMIAASIKLVKINEEILREEMKKRELEKMIIENMPSANKINCLGIKKDGTEEKFSFEASEGIDSSIYEGQVIYAR